MKKSLEGSEGVHRFKVQRFRVTLSLPIIENTVLYPTIYIS